MPDASSNASPASSGTQRCRGWRWCGSAAQGCCRLAWWVFLLALCGALYLWLIGLPGRWLNPLLARLDTAPFALRCARVTFDPTRGLVARNLEARREGDIHAIAVLEQLVVIPDWQAVRAHRLGVAGVAFSGGALRLPPLQPDSEQSICLTVGGLQGRIALTPGVLLIENLQARLVGVHCTVTGSIRLAARAGAPSPARVLSAALDRLQATPSIANAITHLQSLRFDPAPDVQLAMELDLATPASNAASMRLAAGRTGVREANFDALGARLQLRDQRIVLEACELFAGGQRAHLTGQYDLAQGVAEAHVVSELPSGPCLALLPASLRSALATRQFSLGEAMSAEAWLGPTPLSNLLAHVRGWLSIPEAHLGTLPLSRLYASARAKDGRVVLEHLSARLGEGPGSGPLEGTLTWSPDTGVWRGEVETGFDPHLMEPWLTTNQRRLVQRFAFGEEPPLFRARFRARGAREDQLDLEGNLSGADFRYRGVPVVSMETALSFSNRVVTLDRWRIERPEGVVTGFLAADLSTRHYRFDLRGSAEPHAVAAMVGTNLARVLEPVVCEETPLLHARGVIDAGPTDEATDLQVTVDAQRIGVTNWIADQARVVLLVKTNTYWTESASGSLAGGGFVLDVTAVPGPAGSGYVFRASGLLTNASLSRLTSMMHRGVEPGPTGTVRVALDLAGPIEDPGRTALTGTGSLRIREGELMRMPLLGGLSRLLSRVYPGLGFASQNELDATLAFRRGRVYTEDLRLEGGVISLKARGYYAFDGKVNVKTEVQLLRKGPVASVLRLLTFPVTKLLAFQLHGTLDDPQWRPVNLPKELFLIF